MNEVLLIVMYFVDMDECEAAVCSDGSTCVNTPGGYECECPTGYFYNTRQNRCKGKTFISI